MSIAKTFVIYDPFCASRGSNVVHRGFKSKEAADKRLSALLKSDYDGYAGCVVIANKNLPMYGEKPTMKKAIP